MIYQCLVAKIPQVHRNQKKIIKVKTHFLSFTLDKTGMQKNLDDFKEEVLKNCSECEGIDVIMFQSKTKIHLTFGMMMLLSDSDAEKAKELWSQCCEQLVRKHLQDRGVRVELKGVEYAYDDHAGFGVLYAKATTEDGSDRLQKLADGLVEEFVARGLMKKGYDKVNIRAPLMKCKRLTESAAIKIVEFFGDFSFGAHQLDKIRLFTGSYDTDEPLDYVAIDGLPFS